MRLLWLPLAAWVWACMETAPEIHYVSLNVEDIEDSLTAFQRVHIMVVGPPPAGDTLDVLWNDSLPDASKLKRLRANRYRGGDATVIIAGYVGNQLRLRRRIAYSGATGTARILDRDRDTVRPVLTSRLPDDTLTLDSWGRFPDSLVRCEDDRDGVLMRVLDTMPRDIRPPTLYTTLVFCRDLSRNDTRNTADTVMVYLQPPMAPVITLAGRDSIDIPIGGSADSHASCRDEEDGELPVRMAGNLDSAVLGRYILTYTCTDKDGLSTSRRRVIWVSEALDGDPPVVTLDGPDSVDHPLGTPYVDRGAVCIDLRDGPRPIVASGDVDVDIPGVYKWEHKCRDLTGNTTYPVRKVRVLPYRIAPIRSETSVDTTPKSNFVNTGMTPTMAFFRTRPFASDHASLLAFDLGKVDRDSVASARGVFHVYITGPYRPGLDTLRIVFRAYRIRSPWTEGTGNWFYNRGIYQNRGHIYLRNHALRAEIKAKSTDPIVRSGFTKEDKAILRIPNMQEAGGDSLTAVFRAENFSQGHPGVLPAKENLVPLEIDLTRYVKEGVAGEDHGLVILAEGMPDNNDLGWVTHELGEGDLAPYIKVFYP